MDEETGPAWLDREHRCLVRWSFSGRPYRRHGCGIVTQPVYGWVCVAGGRGRSRDARRARRHDDRHAAGIVGRAVGRQPVAMSLFSGPSVTQRGPYMRFRRQTTLSGHFRAGALERSQSASRSLAPAVYEPCDLSFRVGALK